MTHATKHLYIHIPFCKSICSYCDFVRFVNDKTTMHTYVNKIIKELQTKAQLHQFDTIYVGGGTPNSLDDDLLILLLRTLGKYLSKHYEFTIECNPEHLTLTQAHLLNANKVNRVSIGMQTTNNTLLTKFRRHHTLNDVKNAISNLRKVGIENISIDLIYGFNELTNADLHNTIKFIKTMQIPHISWYALEVKPGALIHKQNYQLNDENVEHHLRFLIKHLQVLGYERYEVSNWTQSTKYQSQHNLAYWLTKDWMAIGLGACGYENKIYYENVGNVCKWHKQLTKYSQQDVYFQVMLMGLRLRDGLDLSQDLYHRAYIYYKDKLIHTHISKGHLMIDNLNLLDDTLIKLV